MVYCEFPIGSTTDLNEAYLNECISKAKPNLSKIKDVDKALDEIRGEVPEVTDEIRDEMDADMEESGMAQGEIESCLNHWNNKYVILRKEWISKSQDEIN